MDLTKQKELTNYIEEILVVLHKQKQMIKLMSAISENNFDLAEWIDKELVELSKEEAKLKAEIERLN